MGKAQTDMRALLKTKSFQKVIETDKNTGRLFYNLYIAMAERYKKNPDYKVMLV